MMPAKIDEDFAAAKAARSKTLCNVGTAMKDRTKGASIGRVVDDLTYSAPAISKVLQKHGFKVSASSVRGHRRQECACFGIVQ